MGEWVVFQSRILSSPIPLILPINKVPLLQSFEWFIKLWVGGTCNFIGMAEDNSIEDGTSNEVAGEVCVEESKKSLNEGLEAERRTLYEFDQLISFDQWSTL